MMDTAGMRGAFFRVFWMGAALCAFSAEALPYALTGIYDFRPLVGQRSDLTQEQRDFPALVYEFEGLTFTQDGSLWASIAANPRGASKELWRLDLAHGTRTGFPHPGSIGVPPFLVSLASVGNPVALASIGDQLVVGHYFGQYGNLVGLVDPATRTWTPRFFLGTALCSGVQGLAYARGKLYAGCQSDQKILELDPVTGAVSRSLALPDGVLGLDATDDGRLVVGTYPGRQLLIVDPDGQRPTVTIDLADLFVDSLNGPSDYHRLAGSPYQVQVTPSEGVRAIPDPDGLAYRDGRIYMSFDGDLRIFEISLEVAEPGALALLAVGLTALGWRRRRARPEAGSVGAQGLDDQPDPVVGSLR